MIVSERVSLGVSRSNHNAPSEPMNRTLSYELPLSEHIWIRRLMSLAGHALAWIVCTVCAFDPQRVQSQPATNLNPNTQHYRFRVTPAPGR